MARLPRIYLVTGTWPDTSRKTRKYLTPEAADERREKWEAKGATATVQPSYPVAFPDIKGDRFDIPDGLISRDTWHDLAARLGIKPEAVRGITVTPTQIVVEYDPEPKRPGKAEPRLWLIQIEEG